MRRVDVNISKKYSVWIGEGLIARAGDMIAAACGGGRDIGGGGVRDWSGGSVASITSDKFGDGSVMIVSDDIVNDIYGDVFEESLREVGYATERFVFPHGEQ